MNVIITQASSETLSKFGIVKGMTEEKRFGNVKTTNNFDKDESKHLFKQRAVELANEKLK